MESHRNKPALALSGETVRVLRSDQLSLAHGGARVTSTTDEMGRCCYSNDPYECTATCPTQGASCYC